MACAFVPVQVGLGVARGHRDVVLISRAVARDDGPLIAYESLGRDAMLSVPTPEHYLPLLYAIALRREGDPVSFPVEGVDGGSISMLSVRIG